MRNVPLLGLAAVALLALASCTDGGTTQSPSPTATAQAKVYSEDELRELISGMTDRDGNELRLYSKDQVGQGRDVARVLMDNATVTPEDCKSIASAGLLESVENGDVAVAISDSQEPRTLSAQSSSEGPDAVGLLNEISGKIDQCSSFTVELLGQRQDVTSRELEADTDGDETFATISTRGEGTSDMLMQVSAAEERLLVVATKSGADLGDADQDELEELVNRVLAKAEQGAMGTTTGTATGTATVSPTDTSTRTGTPTTPSTPNETATEQGTATISPTETPTVTTSP